MRDEYIRRAVWGRSFVDVGPLWVVENEKLSTAANYGATRLTAIDQFPMGDPLWTSLKRRMSLKGIPCNYISCDVCQFQGAFDVVYCSGVLYHHPSPIVLLNHLNRICNSHLILSTVFVQPHVVNTAGEINLCPGGSLFLPGVPEREMKVLREDWRQFLGGKAAGAMEHEIQQWDSSNLYHWWWLFTVEAIEGMCRATGFTILDRHQEDRIVTLFLEKRHD